MMFVDDMPLGSATPGDFPQEITQAAYLMMPSHSESHQLILDFKKSRK
jgi:hypothetical protein